MTTANSAAISPATPASPRPTPLTPRQLDRSIRRALWRKELAECRPAAIAGAAIYLGLPLLWSGIYWLLDPKVGGAATVLLLLTGWLFAAVLAAQTITRDFGRPQGAFLLTQPVTVDAIVRAKIAVAFGLIVVSLLAGGIVDLALLFLSSVVDSGLGTLWLVAAGTTVLSFWLALLAAAITRKTLAGVMLAALALVLMVTLPLISHRVGGWQHPYASDMSDGTRAWVVPAVLAGLGLLVLIAVLSALTIAACRSQRTARLGKKGLAWMIAGVLSLVFVLGMREVGANMPVTAVYWHSPGACSEIDVAYRPGAEPILALFNQRKLACGRDRIALSSESGLRLYNVGQNGEIHDLSEQLHNWAPPGFFSLCAPAPVFDERDELFTVNAVVSQPDAAAKQSLGPVSPRAGSVAMLRSVAWSRCEYGPMLELEAPPELPRNAVWFVTDAAIVDGRLGIVFARRDPAMPKNTLGARIVAAYDLAQPSTPTLIWSEPLHADFSGNLRMRLQSGHLTAPRETKTLDPLPRELETVRAPPWIWVNLPLGDATYVESDRSGFFVVRQFRPMRSTTTAAPEARIIGSVPASPWAWLFRNPTQLLSPRPGLVWEIHETSALAYDVSDPYRPRRIAHVTTYPIQNAVVGPEFLLLDHGLGFSLVKHPPARVEGRVE